MIEAVQIAKVIEAQQLLHECTQVLTGLHFGPGRPGLEEVLGIVRALVVHCARAGGRTQEDVATMLGYDRQQRVSDMLKHKIKLADWRTRLSVPETKRA